MIKSIQMFILLTTWPLSCRGGLHVWVQQVSTRDLQRCWDDRLHRVPP